MIKLLIRFLRLKYLKWRFPDNRSFEETYQAAQQKLIRIGQTDHVLDWASIEKNNQLIESGYGVKIGKTKVINK